MSILFCTVVHRIGAKLCLLLIVLAFLLVGCGAPDKERVSRDFKQLFTKEVGTKVQPIIISTGPGEGDADNVYQHIRFDVLAEEDVALKEGWLAGTTLSKGQKLYGGEVVVLYQKKSGLEWVIARYNLTRAPVQSR